VWKQNGSGGLANGCASMTDSARTGAVRSRRVSSCASRGVRLAMLWHHMCVGRGSSTREQENPRVRREVGIANPFGSIVSPHDP
jgi:hypothetical protein